MTIEEIKIRLRRPATRFETGGFRPSGLLNECWIGKVIGYLPDEGLPVDVDGFSMIPLAQFGLGSLCYPCCALEGLELLTIFVSSKRLPEPFARMGNHFCIREYSSLAALVPKMLENPQSRLKAFPLKPIALEEDYPVWDDEQMDLTDEVLHLEDTGEIDSYYDFATNCSDHKVGGYPSYCQSGEAFSEGFEFVFQVSSDAKANLNIVDGGSLMFAKNMASGEWEVYYDFM